MTVSLNRIDTQVVKIDCLGTKVKISPTLFLLFSHFTPFPAFWGPHPVVINRQPEVHDASEDPLEHVKQHITIAANDYSIGSDMYLQHMEFDVCIATLYT